MALFLIRGSLKNPRLVFMLKPASSRRLASWGAVEKKMGENVCEDSGALNFRSPFLAHHTNWLEAWEEVYTKMCKNIISFIIII